MIRVCTTLCLHLCLLAYSSTAFALGGSTCATATVVGALPYSDSGQLDSGLDPNCPGEPVNDLFYVFTAPQTGYFRFDMCGSNSCCGHQLSIWGNGLCCSGSAVIINSGCPDGYPLRELYMLVGQTIYIEIGKSGTEWADAPMYQFNVSLISDACPGSVITALPYSHSGSTQFATHQYSGTCYPHGFAPDVVFQFTSLEWVLLRASMVANWDDCMQVRKNNCATGASIQCDVGSGPDSLWFDFLAEPDSTYYFIVDGASNADFGPYTFTLQDITLPNDVCPGTVIPALPYTDNGTTASVTHQYSGSCYTESAPDVVYQFTSPDSLVLRASMVAWWFDCMQVRTNNCATGASLQCDSGSGPDSSWFNFVAEPDSTYYFIVDGAYNTAFGPYTFTLQDVTLPNDFCPGTVIPALPYSDTGSTEFATDQYFGSYCGRLEPDVVYQFTSIDSVIVRASMVASWYECMQVRRNNCATGATLLWDYGLGADSSWFQFWAEPDSTYYFIVDGTFEPGFGQYTFTLQEIPIQNDSCPGTFIPALPYTETGSTYFATHQYSCSCYTQSARDVVYQYTSPGSVVLRASMDFIWNSSCMQIRMNDCTNGPLVQCDYSIGPGSSWFDFLAEPDSTYYFMLDGEGPYYSTYTFTLQESPVQNDFCPGTVIPALPYTDSVDCTPRAGESLQEVLV